MKHQTVRKRLLMESLMIMGGLLVAGGIVYYLSMMHEEYAQQNLSLQTQVASLNNEMTSLNDKYTKIRKNHEIYEEAKSKNTSEGLTTSRETIRKLLAGYNVKYYLRNMSLQMTGVQEISDAPYKRKTSVMTMSEVTITADALTDEDVFKLINAIETEFPGAVKMTKITITRKNRLTPDIAREIVQEGEIKMVSASIKFLWLGIAPVEAASAQPVPPANLRGPANVPLR